MSNWPPSEVAELRAVYEQSGGEYSQFCLDLLGRLFPRKESEHYCTAIAAWDGIAKASREEPDWILISHYIETALARSKGPHESKSDKRRRYKKVAQAARTFAAAIRETGLDLIPKGDMDENACHELFLRDMQEQRPIFQTIPLGNRNIERFFRFDPLSNIWAKGSGPSMSRLAIFLAQQADQIAQDAMTEHRMVGHLKRPSAQRTYFIRQLAHSFHFHYGEYLRVTIANFATLALSKTVFEEDVDSALRGFEPKEWDPFY